MQPRISYTVAPVTLYDSRILSTYNYIHIFLVYPLYYSLCKIPTSGLNHTISFIPTTIIWVPRPKCIHILAYHPFAFKFTTPIIHTPHHSTLSTIIHNTYHNLHPKTHCDQACLSSIFSQQHPVCIYFSNCDSSSLTCMSLNFSLKNDFIHSYFYFILLCVPVS